MQAAAMAAAAAVKMRRRAPASHNLHTTGATIAEQPRGFSGLRRRASVSQIMQSVRETSEAAHEFMTTIATDKAHPHTQLSSALLRTFTNLYRIIVRRSTMVVYLVMCFNFVLQPCLTSAVFPLFVFGFAILNNPMQLPHLQGGLLHPLVQNPPHGLWKAVLVYAMGLVLAKFVFQLPIFCVCYTRYALYPECDSNAQCTAPEVQVNFAVDRLWGVYKLWGTAGADATSVAAATAAAVSAGVATSKDIIDGAGAGTFILSTIPDWMVIVTISLHIYIMRRQGVWHSGRVPENKYEEEVGDEEKGSAAVTNSESVKVLRHRLSLERNSDASAHAETMGRLTAAFASSRHNGRRPSDAALLQGQRSRRSRCKRYCCRECCHEPGAPYSANMVRLLKLRDKFCVGLRHAALEFHLIRAPQQKSKLADWNGGRERVQ